ncbi:hypothetical protein QTA58_05120 [Neorhizobium sp. CSC1952]|uniref:hypothetical protein n=1 Tax=Neorhizobium sp. CSC1952 TaxID=2978974 RepID=UPI0025A6585C|nr:hypothetical protein [Rhizobium sp. CSC1952]WJR68142.1 hypothetical protein QTA58_05120 [Rhizobium sp. CSC1952]
MKLDKEQDRTIRLGLIENSRINGALVMVVADLIRRVQAAEVERPALEEKEAA